MCLILREIELHIPILLDAEYRKIVSPDGDVHHDRASQLPLEKERNHSALSNQKILPTEEL